MSLYNEDELIVPKWLNQEFFEVALGSYEKNNGVEVLEFKISPASLKGDHYGSVMFRTKVSYRLSTSSPTVTKSLIVKTVHEDSEKSEVLKQVPFFETETSMYSEALPRIEQILAKSGDKVQFAPKIIYHTLKPVRCIVLEDLCELGYQVPRGLLTEKELKSIYAKLAKLHAVSFMIGKSEDRDLVTKYKSGVLSSVVMASNSLFEDGKRRFIEMLTAYDEFDKYVPKIKALEKNLISDCKQLYKAYGNGDKGEIFVLNHGDVHSKNLMFKYNEKGEFEDFLMVDFQLSVFAPSVVDLIYSVYMLMDKEGRAEPSAFFHSYFEEFIATLKLIGYQGDLPKFADLQIAILRHRSYAIYLLSTLMPINISLMKRNPEDMKDVNTVNVFNQEDAMAMLYRNPALINEMKTLLPKLLNAGYLD